MASEQRPRLPAQPADQELQESGFEDSGGHDSDTSVPVYDGVSEFTDEVEQSPAALDFDAVLSTINVSSDGDHSVLLRLINSPQLTVFQCIILLVKFSGSVGIHFQACQRLRAYPRALVEFYLPQLVQIVITVETESAALEELLMEMSTSNTHIMLLMFWHLQASLGDLAGVPQSYGFVVAKRLYNKIQYELFAYGDAPTVSLRENAPPAMVLASMVASSLVPLAGQTIKPLVLSQGRRQRSNLLRLASKLRGKSVEPEYHSESAEESDSIKAKDRARSFGIHETGARSMPNLTQSGPTYEQAARRMSGDVSKKTAEKQLKMNYFKCETQFLYSLESIANKLVSVPRAARLSALQVELALINRDLPAEVDIPGLMVTNLIGKQDRIVRISPSEATVLNSAEKAPYLLLVEFLKDDLTFNPETDRNKHILATQSERRYLFERSFHSILAGESRQPSPAPPVLEDVGPEEKDMADFSLSELETFDADIANEGLDVNVDTSDGNPLSAQEAKAVAQAAAGGNANPTDITSLATQMRTASIILAQLDGVDGSKLKKTDIAAIKSKIIENMQSMQGFEALVRGEAGDRKLENDLKTAGLSASDDPSAANLGEDWNARRERIRKSSPFGRQPNWDLFSVIVKTGDDLRQEALASQLIQAAQKVWIGAGVNVWVKKMGILITGANSGLVETITNGLSIHSIKKALVAASSDAAVTGDGTATAEPAPIAVLSQHFRAKFGAPNTRRHQIALQNFVKSLAPYSLLCYILQIRDRHNGNILLDNDGHIIHIDFGFMLSNAPGGRFSVEAAPFKLTQEYVDLIGGLESELYAQFLKLLKESFRALRAHAEEFVTFVDIMAKNSPLPCFQNGPATAVQLRQRFQLQMTDNEADNFVENVLVFKSYRSVYTRLYDQFQMVTQGILS